MKGLLSNALYTSHYTSKSLLSFSEWEKSRHILQRLSENHDIVPFAGTTAGFMVGGSIIILSLSIWHLCLCRRRRRQSSSSEYVNLLAMVSRATSDDSHYNQHQKQQQRRSRKKPITNTNWWNLLLSKKPTGADSPIPKISGPACYLLYEPDNGGQLVLFYNSTVPFHWICSPQPLKELSRPSWPNRIEFNSLDDRSYPSTTQRLSRDWLFLSRCFPLW